MTLDTGKNTVTKTRGWVAPDGADPFNHWVDGVAAIDGSSFEMPIITHVEGNLWHGGYVDNIDLGDKFDVIVSLYPWEKWPTKGETHQFTMYDGLEVDVATIMAAAAMVDQALREGKRVLVHCQAGLNRSSVVVATVLIKRGRSPEEAIKLLRDKRSPAVLCNPSLERFLHGR